MPQQLALLCCGLFILWLFRRDPNRRKVSFALWIPLAWGFIVGSKPLSIWLGYQNPSPSLESYVEGSPFDRWVFLSLIGAGCLVLVKRGLRWRRFFRNNRWLCLYFLYLGISALWSDYPFVSFKRWIKDAGNVIMVLVVLTEEHPLEAIKALLARCVYLLIPLSVLLVKYYAEVGRYYDRWTWKPYFCGVATDKNLLGMTLFVCGLSLFWMLLELRSPKVRRQDKGGFYVCLFLLTMTLWLLVKSQSSTAVVCVLLGCCLLVGMKFPAIRSKAHRIGTYGIALILLIAFLQVAFDVGGVFVRLLGRDVTLTGRTEIWATLLKEPVNPVFGEGFYSFWMGDRVQRLSEKYFYQLNEAHNGYLETYLNSGLIGLGLLLGMLASVGSRIQREARTGSEFGAFRLALLISNIIYNVTEATFDRLDLLWFTLLLLIVEYPSRVKVPARNTPETPSSAVSGSDAIRQWVALLAARQILGFGSLRAKVAPVMTKSLLSYVTGPRFLASGFLFLMIQFAQGDIIPANRRVDWSYSGIPGGIPERTVVYTTLNSGASLSQVQTALNNCPANQVVKLGAGAYTWSGDLDWSKVKDGVVLRGAGPENTFITFSSGSIIMRHAFSEAALSVEVNLAQNAAKGDTTITLASVPSWVIPGHIYIIDQLNDPAIAKKDGQESGLIYRGAVGNGDRGIGQTVKVVSVTKTTVTFEIPLYLDYRVANGAQLAEAAYNPMAATPLRQCGIEDLRITASYSSGNIHAIKMENCEQCWLKNIVSVNGPGGCHVWTAFSYRCEIRDCRFEASHVYGSGQGYGVGLYHMSCAFRVENNIFKKLHVAMQVNYGSSGNVFGYNCFVDGQSNSGQQPGISAHGCHAFMNLFEGNFTENKVLGDYTHGSSSHNTLFRNRIVGHEPGDSLDQVAISLERYSRHWNIVANVLGEKGWHNVYDAGPGPGYPAGNCADVTKTIFKIGYFSNWGCDSRETDTYTVTDLYRHANYDVVTSTNGGIRWDALNADRTIPPSLYLTAKPAWFGDRPWPPVDPLTPNGAVLTNLPSGYKLTFGSNPPQGPVNQAPIAAANAPLLIGVPLVPIAFSSSGSSDPEGVALTYNWTFGDGATSTDPNPTHSYSAVGTYTVRLTVSDGVNTSSANSLGVTINVATGGQAPVVEARATPAWGVTPLVVSFSSAGSVDPEGRPLSYNWTFGDGTTSTEANPSHTYQVANNYSARLTVSDGFISAFSSTMTIIATNLAVSATNGGLVAAYGFEEGSGAGVTDSSGNGNHGTANGATWTDGKFGNAMSFGGSSVVVINDAASLDLTGGMTLEAWVYPNTLSGWRDVIYKDTDTYFLMGSTPQGRVPDMGGTFASANVYGPEALPIKTWSHLAGTYDGTTMRIYVNGVQVASKAQTGPITTSTGALSIGGDMTNGQYWDGLIDEVRIYNRALTAAEILADGNTPVIPVVAPPPLAPPQGLRVVGP